MSPRKRERERFRPNSVGQSIKRREKREEKKCNETSYYRMNVDFKKQTNIPPPTNIASSSRPCFVVNPFPGLMSYVVWCGVDFECEHRSQCPKRENRIHPLDGWSVFKSVAVIVGVIMRCSHRIYIEKTL